MEIACGQGRDGPGGVLRCTEGFYALVPLPRGCDGLHAGGGDDSRTRVADMELNISRIAECVPLLLLLCQALLFIFDRRNEYEGATSAAHDRADWRR